MSLKNFDAVSLLAEKVEIRLARGEMDLFINSVFKNGGFQLSPLALWTPPV